MVETVSGPMHPMKLIIQIPCLNEAETLPVTLADLPHHVPGFERVELLVIDDGSTDDTVEVARSLGVEHIVSFNANKGLAVAFHAGIDACLKLGADVIVNTDADNQYRGEDVLKLVEPIVERRADMVIGDRQVQHHPEFSRTKKLLQRLGSWVVRRASATEVPDTTSGFRAYTRDAALRLNVVSRFSYTLETLIQAGKSDIAVTSVPIRTNPRTRESRLFTSNFQYIRRSIGTIVRIWAMYSPLPAFLLPALVFALGGVALMSRFLWRYFTTTGPTGHVQSLVLGAAFLIVAFMLVMLGIIGNLLSANRVLTERTLYRIRHLELSLGVPPDVPRERLSDQASADEGSRRAERSLEDLTETATRSKT
jgi:glycosyltransferase involved in cell wall biosynthesis